MSEPYLSGEASKYFLSHAKSNKYLAAPNVITGLRRLWVICLSHSPDVDTSGYHDRIRSGFFSPHVFTLIQRKRSAFFDEQANFQTMPFLKKFRPLRGNR